MPTSIDLATSCSAPINDLFARSESKPQGLTQNAALERLRARGEPTA